jgi:hypothetical protein
LWTSSRRQSEAQAALGPLEASVDSCRVSALLSMVCLDLSVFRKFEYSTRQDLRTGITEIREDEIAQI